jgi:hypothetical protein
VTEGAAVIGRRIVVVPLNARERELVVRAISELVAREGITASAANVLQMLHRPLQERELEALREGEEA